MRLNSCSAACGPNSFAQGFADHTQVNVWAADSSVSFGWPNPANGYPREKGFSFMEGVGGRPRASGGKFSWTNPNKKKSSTNLSHGGS